MLFTGAAPPDASYLQQEFPPEGNDYIQRFGSQKLLVPIKNELKKLDFPKVSNF
jgi:hypothetical protein